MTNDEAFQVINFKMSSVIKLNRKAEELTEITYAYAKFVDTSYSKNFDGKSFGNPESKFFLFNSSSNLCFQQMK